MLLNTCCEVKYGCVATILKLCIFRCVASVAHFFILRGVFMVCKFKYCIYEKDFQCTLPEIAIDENGCCLLAKHVQTVTSNRSPEAEEKYQDFLSNNTARDENPFVEYMKAQGNLTLK